MGMNELIFPLFSAKDNPFPFLFLLSQNVVCFPSCLIKLIDFSLVFLISAESFVVVYNNLIRQRRNYSRSHMLDKLWKFCLDRFGNLP